MPAGGCGTCQTLWQTWREKQLGLRIRAVSRGSLGGSRLASSGGWESDGRAERRSGIHRQIVAEEAKGTVQDVRN